MDFNKIFEGVYNDAAHLRELTYEKGQGISLITGNPDEDFNKWYIFYVDGELQKGTYQGPDAKARFKELKREFPDSVITYKSRLPSQVA